MKTTKTIFRKWRDGSIIALFPAVASTVGNPYYCLSYERVGQHGSACPSTVISVTDAANEEEYKSLAEELGRVGYVLDIRQRVSSKDLDARKAQVA